MGAFFILNLSVLADLSQAVETDSLEGTISYAEVFEVVKAEMAIPSNLLEHVAGRICRALLQRFPSAEAVHLELFKENPPMGAECAGGGVCLELRR